MAGEDMARDPASPALLSQLISHLLSRPTRISPPVRFAALMLIDGMLVLSTLLLVMFALRSPVSALLHDRLSLVMVFCLISLSSFCLAGLYWRSWRFVSFEDSVAIGAALAGGLAAAWAVCLVLSKGLRDIPVDVALFALVHGDLLLVAMIGARMLRRGVGDFARSRLHVPSGEPRDNILLLGELEWIKSMAELVRSDRDSRVNVVGALTFDQRPGRFQIGGIQVLGSPKSLPQITDALALRGKRPTSLVVRDDNMPRPAFVRLVALADQCDLSVARARNPSWGKNGSGKLEIEQFPLSDLLGRPEVTLEREFVERLIRGRRVLVTGAGGTIGGELVRQLATFAPAELVLLDHSEYHLYAIDMQVRESFPDLVCHPELCSIRESSSVRQVFARRQPEIVFHAAALKHVPMVEANPCEGVHTNVLGTRNVADAVCEFGALAMVQVSTDKAVNPVGLMGATKRLGELYCQALDLIGQCDPNSPRFMTVRFGNVLGSSGSLVPLFQRQLEDGKPLTVTHPDMERYFMTVAEAVQLILQSSARAFGTKIDRGTIFVLDMGEPIKIVDIARRMIRLAGLRPEKDVAIKFVGLRPGEKLYEELFDSTEERLRSSIPGVIEARPCPVPLENLIAGFTHLAKLITSGDEEGIRHLLKQMIQAPKRSRWAQTLREMSRESEPIEVDGLAGEVTPPAPDGRLRRRALRPTAYQ